MLVECGLVKATTSDGQEFTFRPSLGRISTLGDPQGVVALFAALFGPRAEEAARFVLASLTDQEDLSSLVGWSEPAEDEKEPPRWCAGQMPAFEQVIIARHLMQHGVAGKSKPGKGDGKFADRFDASEYVAAARVHLGLSSADAEALSMTEFQTMLEMKFPSANKNRDVPTREEYDASLARMKEMGHV